MQTFKTKSSSEHVSFSFSPKLNKTAQSFSRQRLQMGSETTKAKIEKERMRLQAKELEECTF